MPTSQTNSFPNSGVLFTTKTQLLMYHSQQRHGTTNMQEPKSTKILMAQLDSVMPAVKTKLVQTNGKFGNGTVMTTYTISEDASVQAASHAPTLQQTS